MAKLVISIANVQLDEGDDLVCASSLQHELRFSRHIGEPVLVAIPDGDKAVTYQALARLAAFETDISGETLLRIDTIRIFPNPVKTIEVEAMELGLSQISDDLFHRIIDAVIDPQRFEEDAEAMDNVVSIEQFSKQLERQQKKLCSFSGVPTTEGAAYIIRPLLDGGTWHIQNFLFLDPEPGQLFDNFAWTVGPNLEIIIDSQAMSPDVADTVNRKGVLMLSSEVAAMLDRDALAWHRGQFLERLCT